MLQVENANRKVLFYNNLRTRWKEFIEKRVTLKQQLMLENSYHTERILTEKAPDGKNFKIRKFI